MAQTGYTPISIYYSSTAAATPTAGNLVAGELAINTADGKLFYKDSSGVVQTLATKASASGSFTNLAYTGTLTGGTGVVNLGSGQFYKDASGNVGIGTSSPGYKLEVAGIGAFQQVRVSNVNATNLQIVNTTSALTYSLYSANAASNGFNGFGIFDGTAYRLVISSAGNVGIGVTPSAGIRLDVAAAEAVIRCTSTTGTNASYQLFGNTGGSLYVGRDSSSGGITGAAYSNVLLGTGAYPMVFATNSAEAMRIDSVGNVGIGTTSPSGKLDVAGTIKTLGYTVATLPAGVTGMKAYVTNALAPTFGATVVGGGAVTIPVFYNGANWIVG